jgi:energy-converting hydrogenase A subunit R
MILVFDLEGPLSPMDHAAEAMKVIGEKMGRDDFFRLFEMLSLYDDELTLESKPGYNPGDTLRLIAPIVSTHLSDRELRDISERATLTPGAKELIASISDDDVFVASTSYQQHAQTVSKKLGILPENVNCTELPEYRDFPYFDDLMDIFENYKAKGMQTVKPMLDGLFWGQMEYDYLKTKVCGGERKLEVVQKIAEEREIGVNNFIFVGDSITDINALEGVRKSGGLAISFNGNQYSAPKANLAVSSMSLMAIKPLIDSGDVWNFVDEWKVVQNKFKLLSPETMAYFKASRISLPFYDKIGEAPIEEVIARQKEMRKEIRKEYGDLT